MTSSESAPSPVSPPRPSRLAPLVLGISVAVLLLAGTLLLWRAGASTNKVALRDEAKGVTVIEAKGATYRPSRTYVGTLQPWVQAKVGPQLVSAYVGTVLVRPGALVKRGDVLATLDCRNAAAGSQAVAMQAKALETRQAAVAQEAGRVAGLLDGGYVSSNEAEKKRAESDSAAAQLLAEKAKLTGSSLEVNDCILKAPFDGEVAERFIDPGAFVRPGTAILSLVDRQTVRLTADVPEVDFAAVATDTPVTLRLMATSEQLLGKIARRSPSADASTRTIRVEVDLADAQRRMPVGTTAELRVEVGEAAPATEIPLVAASVRGPKASLFVVDQGVAHKRVVAVKGESGGSLFVDVSLPPGTLVVTEGRALLNDGDRVQSTTEVFAPASAPSASAGKGATP